MTADQAARPAGSQPVPDRAVGARLRAIAPALVVAAAFIVGWRLLVALAGYQPSILPTPEAVAGAFVRGWTDGRLATHTATTLVEVALGLVVGGTLGVGLGYLLARSRGAGLVLSPYVVAAQSTPILALSPLLTLWFGPGLVAKVVICTLIVLFPIAVATMVGFRSVDPGLLELGHSLRATPSQLFRTIEVPAALPQILGGFRVGVTLAVVGAIVAEWTGGDKGLGVFINITRQSLFDIPLMFATLLTIALIGLVLYGATVLLERRLVGRRG